MPRNNVLLMMVDQWPARAFSRLGAPMATPHIDRLARSATVFENAFTTCPLCTPARGVLLTARWPHQTGVIDNSAVGYSLQESLSLEERTWIDEAAGQGYQVGYFGKWHLGRNNPECRGALGFDHEVEAGARPYSPATSQYSYDGMKRRYEDFGRQNLKQGRAPFWGDLPKPREQVEPFRVAARGVGFIEQWAAGDRRQPFFLTVSCSAPHFPHYLPPDYVKVAERLRESATLPPSIGDSFEGKPGFHARPWWPCMDTSVLSEDEWRTVVAFSQAHIQMVDEALGHALGALDRLGLADSTDIVFVADHGDMAGAHNRFDKGPYFYDEVWRIPLIIRRPGVAPAVQDAFVSIIDVGQTLFQFIGAPETRRRPRAGRDLTPLLGAGARPVEWPQQAIGIYDRYNGMSFAVRALRDERWKYVWNPQDVDELYDLEADPHELVNLAARPENSGQVAALRARLMDWLRSIGDPLPDEAADLPPAGQILSTGRMGP